MLTRIDVRLKAQNKFLDLFHNIVLDDTYENKKDQDKLNRAHAIFVGLIGTQCIDKLTYTQEQELLGVLNRISA